MRQLPLNYEPWPVLLSAIDDAVTHLGLKDVVFKLDVAKSIICDALHDRNDRRWAQTWTVTVLEMLTHRCNAPSDQLAKAILDAQAVVTSRFVVVDDVEEPTAEEIAAAERVLAAAKRRRR